MATATLPTEIGNTATLSASPVVYDANGVPVPATGTVTCTVVKPDGTTVAPPVTAAPPAPAAASSYSAQVLVDIPGTWRYRFDAALSGGLAASDGGSFTIRPSVLAPGIVTLDEVKAEANYRTNDRKDDAELAGYIAAATELVERHVGPVLPVARIDTFYRPSRTICLRRAPVLSLTSVTGAFYAQTPQVIDPATLRLDQDTGEVVRLDGWPWPPTVVAAYTAGRASVPASVRLATLQLAVHWWQQSQQQASASPAEDLTPGAYSGVPYRILELLRAYRQGPQIA